MLAIPKYEQDWYCYPSDCKYYVLAVSLSDLECENDQELLESEEWVDDEGLSNSLKHDIDAEEDSEPEDVAPVKQAANYCS